MRKINVLVLMGGKSPEHEISLIGGREVVKNLDKKKYNILPAIISKDGNRLQLVSSNELFELENPLILKGTNKNLITKAKTELESVNEIRENIDVVFIAMHGPFGEDGTVQGMLELRGYKYTGSGVLASALGMDKLMFRKVLSSVGIKIPNYVAIRKGDNLSTVKKLLGKAPYFVKPNNQGSSVGNSLVNDFKSLKKAVGTAFRYSDTVLIDHFIKGLELTCAVLGNEKPYALPIVEIHPLKGEFFDYESKYTESGSEEIVPARISASLTKSIQEIAIKVYKEIDCKGFGRVDFILENNKTPYVLEINTIPGLTPMSLMPNAAKAWGIQYAQLLDKIIQSAM